ncbi:MAG: Fic family protein [Candidatus Dadabacteria bacterium]|nr:Fic family protein [Candidatus Dadabacteria bacterium]
MNLEETNKRIEKLFKEWRGLQPLEPEYQEKLEKKIRLDWNFHSNHIEGNPLTVGETVSLLENKLREGGHSARDYDEMEGHDAAINEIKTLAEDTKQTLTEAKLRNLNKMVLGSKPFMKDAITPDGKPTRRKITPGIYKTEPNSVETATGEMHYFSDPSVVPAEMDDLMKWFRKNLDSQSKPIASFIAELHYRFINIHPFDDGNGRVVRLLINYVLLRFGYPPLVIKSENKKSYIAALRKADDGDINALADYLGNALVFWLEKGVKAAKGESIEDIEDADKETEMFIRDQKAKGLRTPLTVEYFEEIYNNSLSDLLENFVKEFSVYADLFHTTLLKTDARLLTPEGMALPVKLLQKTLTDIGINSVIQNENIAKVKEEIANYFMKDDNPDLRETIPTVINGNGFMTTYIVCEYSQYKARQVENPFQLKVTISIIWGELTYQTGIMVTKIRNRYVDSREGTGLKRMDYNIRWSKKEMKEFFAQGKNLVLKTLKEETGA